MFGILPLIFALVIAQTAEGLGPPPRLLSDWPAWVELPLLLLASCLLWWLLVEVAAQLAGRSRSVRLLEWWDNATTVAALLVFAIWCYALHWPALVPMVSLLQLAPFCLLLIAAWHAGGKAWSGRQARREARELVALRLKFGLLPALVALSLFDLLRWTVIEPFFAQAPPAEGALAVLFSLALSFTLVFGVMLLMPVLVVRLWGARSLPPGPHRELIEEGCRRMGVKVRRILRWPSAGGRFYNAAAMGLVARFRYVLFSDDLLRDLGPDQLRAVLGHELGHIRHHHLWIYLAFLLASIFLAWGLGAGLSEWLGTMPGFASLGPEPRLGLVVVLLFVLLLRLIFGWLSRACERQADLAGVELSGDPEHMRQALLSVAALAGQPLDAPSWRHHSIRERVEYLAHVAEEPEEPARHHRRVRGLLLTVLILLAFGIGFALSSPFPQVDPGEWLSEHPQAVTALDAAEAGDWSQLAAWIAQAPEEDFLSLAALVHARIQQTFAAHAEAVAAGSATRSEAQELYRLRGLLYPFVHHQTGHFEFDVTMANNAAYAAVAGTAEPTPEDLEQARAALPLINRAAFAGEGNAAFHDTVGCVLFRLGDRAQARRHFQYALDRAEQLEAIPGFEALLRRRLAAASDPAAELPLEEPPGRAQPSAVVPPASGD